MRTYQQEETYVGGAEWIMVIWSMLELEMNLRSEMKRQIYVAEETFSSLFFE